MPSDPISLITCTERDRVRQDGGGPQGSKCRVQPIKIQWVYKKKTRWLTPKGLLTKKKKKKTNRFCYLRLHSLRWNC